MAQMKVWSWTNPASAVARNEEVGFTVGEITISDLTNGAQWYWNSSMATASYILVSSGAVTLTNGFTALSQSARFGPSMSGFTNANPGVITADDVTTFGFAAGDTIKVAELADDQTGTLSLNNNFTVASVTATTITLVEDTSVTGYSVYVSGGVVTRVSDTNSVPIVIENLAIQGVLLGTGVVGANNASMVAVARGENVVV